MVMRYDVDFINPFLDAVVYILSSMAQVDAVPGKPFISKNFSSQGDVTGLMGVTGYSKGVFSITFSKDAAVAVAGSMMMTEYAIINEDVVDIIAELTNMISGYAREKLSEADIEFDSSPPTVVCGDNHTIDHVADAPVLGIPFSTKDGDLVVAISMEDAE